MALAVGKGLIACEITTYNLNADPDPGSAPNLGHDVFFKIHWLFYLINSFLVNISPFKSGSLQLKRQDVNK